MRHHCIHFGMDVLTLMFYCGLATFLVAVAGVWLKIIVTARRLWEEREKRQSRRERLCSMEAGMSESLVG